MDTFILCNMPLEWILAWVRETTLTVQSRGFTSAEPIPQKNIKCN